MIDIALKEREGKLQLEFSNGRMNIGHFDGKFKGDTEILESMQLVSDHFNNFIKDELTNILGKVLTKSVQASINSDLFADQKILRIGDKGVNLNLTLSQKPVSTYDFVAFPLDGFFSSDKQSIIDFKLQQMPVHFEDGKNFQLFISEESLKSCIQAFADLD